jgi:hypothetical protein
MAVFLTGILPQLLWGQAFQVEQVLPYLSDDSLKADIVVSDLLEDQILKTLLSGLPLQIEIDLMLRSQAQNDLVSKRYFSRLSYDVWEEKFWVMDFRGNIQEFDDLDNVKRWARNLSQLSILSRETLEENQLYQVDVTLTVVLSGEKQEEQLKWWLGNSNPTEEDIASEERSTGFRLNLNQLVRMIFSSDEEPQKYSANGISEKFNLSDLTFQ